MKFCFIVNPANSQSFNTPLLPLERRYLKQQSALNSLVVLFYTIWFWHLNKSSGQVYMLRITCLNEVKTPVHAGREKQKQLLLSQGRRL